MEYFAGLRDLNMGSLLFRLVLAMCTGGLIGLERGRKRRPAGFRTYMLVSLGAAMTILLGQYESVMLSTRWTAVVDAIGQRTDISRIGAQVINGIGFLGAGTILVTGRQQVTGLTTAAGLWASACVGLAVGAGFYEAVFLAFGLIFVCMRILPFIENILIENGRFINVYMEFEAVEQMGSILHWIKEQDMQILEIDVERARGAQTSYPNAVLSLRLNHKQQHTQVLAALADLDGVCKMDEI